jgi:hypothetical protein
MEDIIHNSAGDNEGSAEASHQTAGFMVFDNTVAFSKAVEKATGLAFDVESIIGLDTDFVQASNGYLLLNVKEYGAEQPDNLLFLTEDKAYIFSNKNPSPEAVGTFKDILPKAFGKSTVLSFFVFDKVLESHKQRLESFIKRVKQLEDNFNHVEYLNLTLEFERLGDRLEEFHDLLIRLQESYYKQLDTQLITFDYRVLLAESLSLQGRCRRRLGSLKEVRQEREIRATEELNQRIVRLNDVVKKLTAITVILMIPTLIASHFGMNFAFMPELRIWWAYPAVIAFQFIFMGIGFVLFRKIGWL